MEQSPRDRAISSEPCSGRPNPFEDEAPAHSSRKRQRTSKEGSRSRSADTARNSDILPEPMSLRMENSEAEAAAAAPSTPTRDNSEQQPAGPASSRVTINLRTSRALDAIPSSPPSPTSRTRMTNGGDDAVARFSVESESDALSTAPAIETPSSSSSEGSPKVELVTIDDDSDFAEPLAIIDDDEIYMDPMSNFPYCVEGETLNETVVRVARFFQYEDVDTNEAFCKVRDWIETLLFAHSQSETFYAIYSKYRRFWRSFPDIIWALSSRSKFFGDFLRRSQEGRQSLTDMLIQFARLTGLFVAMDIKTLAEHARNGSDDVPDTASRPFLFAYSWLLRKEEHQHIGRNLDLHYQWSWDDDVVALSEAFQTEGGSIMALTKLLQGELQWMSREPKVIESFANPCKIVAKMVDDAIPCLDNRRNQPSQAIVAAEETMLRGYDFFKVMSAGLDSIIDKHVTFLPSESAAVHLTSLASIFRHALHYQIPAVRDLLDAPRYRDSAILEKQLPEAISVEWKFTILKKLLTSAQMQLRVTGVTSLCQELLGMYNRAKNHDIASHPMLVFFAEFLIDNEIVEYLVGIGSHPEIINESTNILGFLVVTKTYSSELTDKIWQTVTTSQDPRLVEAVLRLLRSNLNLFDYDSLLYLCKRVYGVPIESYTVPMRELCTEMFKRLTGKVVEDRLRPLESPPYDLCVKIVRESSIVNTNLPAGYPELQHFATIRFRELLQHGPGPDVRTGIYLACIEDISSKSPTAPGSICVINALLHMHMKDDLRKLTGEQGLTKLLVEELESVAVGSLDSVDLPVKGSAASNARRELLSAIIIHEPGTISAELGSRLWNVLVGSGSSSALDRDVSWQLLNSAVKNSGNKNVFLSSCFKDYLPLLPPSCFTIGTLDFAREAMYFWIQDVIEESVIPDRKFESPALEQVWRMILTAPPNTIDAAAISVLVEAYVSSKLILGLPLPMARAAHLALVNRCLEQLKGAASKLKMFSDDASSGSDGSMVIVASEGQFQEQEMIFARSLAVLREFLRAYQLAPHFAPPKSRLSITTAPGVLVGEPVAVKYQWFDGHKRSELEQVTIGTMNTVASFFAILEKATSFKSYRVYCGGKQVDPEKIDLNKKWEDVKLTGLVLVWRCGDLDQPQSNGHNAPLEVEITKQFDDLWSYLGMHEKVAQEIFYFLKTFPIYDRMLKDFDSAMPYTEIFPVGQPFKSLYAVHSLRQYIAGEAKKGSVNEIALMRAISLIVASISDPKVLEHCGSDSLRANLALHLMDCLIHFLKEPVLPTSIAPILSNCLLERLLELLYAGRQAETSPSSINLATRSFEALLEASVHNLEFWKGFVSHLQNCDLLQVLILEDPRPFIRKNVVKQIVNKCTFIPSLGQMSTTTFAVAFWPLIAVLIPKATQLPQQCEEIFSLSLTLFKKYAEVALSELDLEDLVRRWSGLLLAHSGVESVGHSESVDMVALGLSNMVFHATSFAKASEKSLTCSKIGTEIFRKHLFPDLSAEEDDVDIISRIPLLNPITRRILTDTVFFLIKDDSEQYKALLADLSRLVPHCVTDDVTYSYTLSFQFDRSKSIRSSTGYVGLRNLSNTCYLNSLFTQLFMNLPFREFMLNTRVSNAASTQKLLSETQTLFSYMQNSLDRYVDPTNLASSIRTYEETQIDVTVQMDVDEFYNLLFERWESQIPSAEAKRKFKSFYGGQLVQQVKSKECPHISERLESFSAIQCDIKGKSSLEESLQAYVEGEVMEGDNKYKCSTCDRHVDAVKRACLKTIPDNLIFHLKRFDFNLRTLMRSKINDHFAFPEEIDMRPYKVEHLMEPSADIPEDKFELVGILIHSGTAESGHYYSYTRERPSTGDNQSWVEFNDDLVTPWDPSMMESSCFGGPDYRGPSDGSTPFDKTWSAYMLFYQRSSVLAAQKKNMEIARLQSPIRLPVPRRLSNHISMENELLMRRYCLHDPSHATFVIKMLSNMRNFNGGQCSQAHTMEKIALTGALHHLDQVFARTKDLPDFTAFMLSLKQICQSCAECSRDFLEWFADYPEALRQLLLRNPEGLIRHDIAMSILAALTKVKADASYAYGLGEDDEDADASSGSDPQLIQGVVRCLNKLYEVFHANTRAWPEYFGLLSSIANMGKPEAALLLDAGFLRKTLEIITADPLLPTLPQYTKMLNILSRRLANRPVSYDAVITLLHTLLVTCDDTLESISENEERLDLALADVPIPLTHAEHHLLVQHWTRNQANILMEKLLQLRQNQEATGDILTRLLEWPESIDVNIFQAIVAGFRKASATNLVGSFLRAATIYCQQSQNPKAVASMVAQVTKASTHLDTGEGGAILQFFKDIYEPPIMDSNMTAEEFLTFYFDQMAVWGPHLLTDYDMGVRVDTQDFIQKAIFDHGPNPDFGPAEEDIEKADAMIRAGRQLGLACLEFCREHYIMGSRQAIRVVVKNIESVIDSCVAYFDFEEPKDAATRRFYEQHTYVLSALKKSAIDEVDEDISDDWGSDGYNSSASEFGTAEPSGPIGDDDVL